MYTSNNSRNALVERREIRKRRRELDRKRVKFMKIELGIIAGLLLVIMCFAANMNNMSKRNLELQSKLNTANQEILDLKTEAFDKECSLQPNTYKVTKSVCDGGVTYMTIEYNGQNYEFHVNTELTNPRWITFDTNDMDDPRFWEIESIR